MRQSWKDTVRVDGKRIDAIYKQIDYTVGFVDEDGAAAILA